jgi:PTS system mannose-specific IIA component
MVNFVIVSHGKLAEGLVDAMALIAGEQEGVLCVALNEEDAIDGLAERVDTAVRRVYSDDGVLILVDLFGASPFNISAQLTQKHARTQVVTGVNLPMLLETVMMRESLTLEELAALANETGKSGIKSLAEILKESESGQGSES